MPPDSGESITSLITRLGTGDDGVAGRLVEQLYPELKRLAIARMSRERQEHTWQPSALVNEFYMELVKSRRLRVSAQGERDKKAAFLAVAAHLMSRLLVHHARRLSARIRKSSLDDNDAALPQAVEADAEGARAVEAALDKLQSINPRLRSVVELRVFEGLSGEETAERLGCSHRTVIRDWNFARALIAKELSLTINAHQS